MNRNGYNNRRSNHRQGQTSSNRRVQRSICDDVACRGTPEQLVESWQNLSDQARGEGDPICAERFGQQAEHYRRIYSEIACV